MQEFTPTPGTASTCMYYTAADPSTGRKLYVACSDSERRLQKAILLWHLPEERERALKGLSGAGRGDLATRIRLLAGTGVLPVAVRAKRKPR